MKLSLPGDLLLAPLYQLSKVASKQPCWKFDASKESSSDYIDLFIVRDDSRENGCYALALSDRLGDKHKALWVIHIEKTALSCRNFQELASKTHFYLIYSVQSESLVSCCSTHLDRLDESTRKHTIPFILGIIYGTYLRIRELKQLSLDAGVVTGETR